MQECLEDVFQIDAQVMVQDKADAPCLNKRQIVLVQIMGDVDVRRDLVLLKHIQDRDVAPTHRIDRA